MDYGDLVRLIFLGFIILSFASGLFGKSGKKKQDAKPARPTEIGESGGQPQPMPRPVMVDPANAAPVLTGEGVSRTEARREELLERFGDQLGAPRIEPPPPEVVAPATDGGATVRRPRPPQPTRRRHRYVEGSEVLRRSLKDPATLERAFIVKEVLDRPVGLRNDR